MQFATIDYEQLDQVARITLRRLGVRPPPIGRRAATLARILLPEAGDALVFEMFDPNFNFLAGARSGAKSPATSIELA